MRSLHAIMASVAAMVAATAAAQEVAESPSPEPEPAASAADAEEPAATRDAAAGRHASGGRSAGAVRRRDSSVIGGWVSARAEGALLAVDEFVFLSNGEWRRRTVEVDPASGLVLTAGTDPAGVEDGGSAGREPGETHGIWYTEEGFLVLIERGPGAREDLRLRYELDERAEKLTLPAGEAGGAVAYHRYR